MTWARYGIGGLAMLLGFAAVMTGVDGLLSGAPNMLVGAGIVLLGICVIVVRFIPKAPEQLFVQEPSSQAPDDVEPVASQGHERTEAAVQIAASPDLASENEPADEQSSVCLQVCLPVQGENPGSSWIGGTPQLPANVAWPKFQDEYGQFMAQLSCDDLPDALWGGLGPRQGALALFRFSETHEGAWPVRILHVDGLLTPIAAPGGMRSDPCWPLGVAETGSEEQSPQTDPDWDRLHGLDLNDPAFRPFDWPSASKLLVALKTLLQRLGKGSSYDGFSDAEKRILADSAQGLAALAETTWAMRSQTGFTQELSLKLVEGLSGLMLPVDGQPPVSLTRHPCLRRAFYEPFELYCRQVYARNPDSLPAVQRALFEPLWTHNARFEGVTLGFGEDEMISTAQTTLEDPIMLLELPSSELAGWTFGTGRCLRVFVTCDDLKNGDFSEAWATVTRDDGNVS